jgi:hypothetical protein
MLSQIHRCFALFFLIGFWSFSAQAGFSTSHPFHPLNPIGFTNPASPLYAGKNHHHKSVSSEECLAQVDRMGIPRESDIVIEWQSIGEKVAKDDAQMNFGICANDAKSSEECYAVDAVEFAYGDKELKTIRVSAYDLGCALAEKPTAADQFAIDITEDNWIYSEAIFGYRFIKFEELSESPLEINFSGDANGTRATIRLERQPTVQ